MARKSLLLIPLTLIIAACGTIATPVFEEELQETRIAQAATAAAETAAAPTTTPTVTPSETPVPTDTPTEAPTNTPIPATNTSEPPTSTSAPTEAPTEASAGDGSEASALPGDPVNGQVLFTTFQAAANFACNTCHLPDSEAQLIGPGLLNVSARAETRVPGQSAEEYLRNSILHPSEFVVPNFPDMLMPQVYGTVFTEDQINDLVAYLFTLKG